MYKKSKSGYMYLKDTLYVNKGRLFQRQKTASRIPSQEDTQSFYNNCIKEEVGLRINYWESLIINRSAFKHPGIKKVEFLRSFFVRHKRFLEQLDESRLDIDFAVDFVYNSNRIEGSRLPKYKVKEFAAGNRNANNEVVNTLRAIKIIDEFELRKLSVLSLKKFHSVLLADETAKHGFRKEPIVVGNSETLDYRKIRSELSELLCWLKKNMYKMYPPELAFMFHYRFERIHPFKDGNGRIGRLLMNKILKEHKYHPIIIWETHRDAYFSTFQKAIDGNLKPFFRFMVSQYVESYETYIDKVKKNLRRD